jgi:hypothetical protein
MYGFRTKLAAGLVALGILLGARTGEAITDPTDITGLQLWLDAADVDGDGNSVNDPSDGAVVVTWADKSGNGRDVSAVASQEPLFTLDQLGGNPVLMFDGNDDRMIASSVGMPAREIIAVVMCKSAYPSLAGVVSNGNDQLNIRIHNTANKYRGNTDDQSNDFSGTAGVFRVNGVVIDNFTPDVPHWISSVADADETYANFWVGRPKSDLNCTWKGFIAEIIIYDVALTSVQRAEVMAYLEDKWWPGGSPNLVGHWKLDDYPGSGTWTTAADSSGSGNDGMLTNMDANETDWVEGRVGTYALDFDGANDFVAVANSTDFDVAGWTVSGWFKAPSDITGVDYRVIVGRETGNTDCQFWVSLNPTTGAFLVKYSSGALEVTVNTPTTDMRDNAWHHFALTASGITVTFYLDGVASAPTNGGAPDIPVADVTIGDQTTGGRPWKGRIDDVRFYDRTLSDAEVLEVAGGLEAGLVAHWKFDESGGAIAPDASGNGFDGSLVGTMTWMPAGGHTDGALYFDGSASYVDVSSVVPVLNGLSGITVAAWVKANAIGADRGFLNNALQGGDDLLCCRFDDAGTAGGDDVIKLNVPTSSGDSLLEGSDFAQTTEWLHVAFTWKDGQEARLYLDGELDTPTLVPAVRTGTVSGIPTLWIGAGPKNPWLGLIDDFRIYSRALSAAEIQDLFDPNIPADGVHHEPRRGRHVRQRCGRHDHRERERRRRRGHGGPVLPGRHAHHRHRDGQRRRHVERHVDRRGRRRSRAHGRGHRRRRREDPVRPSGERLRRDRRDGRGDAVGRDGGRRDGHVHDHPPRHERLGRPGRYVRHHGRRRGRGPRRRLHAFRRDDRDDGDDPRYGVVGGHHADDGGRRGRRGG